MEKTFLITLLTCVFTIIFFIIIYKKFSILSKGTLNFVIVFIILSFFFGKALSFYAKVPYYDKYLHLISGFLFAKAGSDIYTYSGGRKDTKALFFLFPLFFAFSAAGFWEIWEFSGDTLLNLNAQNNSLFDTMTDIILGFSGAVLKVFIFDIFIKKT